MDPFGVTEGSTVFADLNTDLAFLVWMHLHNAGEDQHVALTEDGLLVALGHTGKAAVLNAYDALNITRPAGETKINTCQCEG